MKKEKCKEIWRVSRRMDETLEGVLFEKFKVGKVVQGFISIKSIKGWNRLECSIFVVLEQLLENRTVAEQMTEMLSGTIEVK